MNAPQKFTPGPGLPDAHPDAKQFLGRIGQPERSTDRPTPQESVATEHPIELQKRLMGSCKALIPLVIAIIKNPGTMASPDCRADAMALMIDSSEAFSERFMDIAAPTFKNAAWARHESFTMASGIFSDEWASTGNIDAAAAVLGDEHFFDDLAHAIGKTRDHAFDWLEKSGETPPIKTEDEAASRVRLSVARAALPLYAQVSKFQFWQDRISPDAARKIMERLIDELSEMAAEYANETADANGIDPHGRLMLWQGTIGRVFSIATVEYEQLAKLAQRSTELPDAQRRASARAKWARSLDPIGVVIENTVTSSVVFNNLVASYMKGLFSKHAQGRKRTPSEDQSPSHEQLEPSRRGRS